MRAWGKKREKIFGHQYGRGMDRNQKARIEVYARAWSTANKHPGQHRGPLTRATLEVLNILLWKFHNSKSGLCFPSYETIANKAECAVSTVAKAVKALEAAGIMTWAHRLLPVNWKGGCKLVRQSNAYAFSENLGNLSPQHKIGGSKSENRRRTPNQDLSYTMCGGKSVDKPESEATRAALKALASARTEKFNQEWLERMED